MWKVDEEASRRFCLEAPQGGPEVRVIDTDQQAASNDRQGLTTDPTSRRPRVLCYVNHYYGPHPTFRGKSTTQTRDVRRQIVERTLAALRALDGDMDVRVCGIPGRALVPIDIPFDLSEPRHLVFETLVNMSRQQERYDYFINIEDDVEVPAETFRNILEFDREALINECLHPNRLERREGQVHCVDLEALPGWNFQEKTFRGRLLRTALNPHSAVLVLSREKLGYALRHVDPSFRGTVVGGLMASAYAHWHKPFVLWRTADEPEAHAVVHLDDWLPLGTPALRIADLDFTAILLSWKRAQNLPAIIAELSRIPEIREILVWNNDPERTLDLPGVNVVNAPANFRRLARYCLVPLAKHDHIWFQDDDLLVSAEQFHELLRHYQNDRARIVGCRGHNIRDGKYVYEDAYGEVDVVLGQTMMFHRGMLAAAFAALGELPPPTHDDIAFSLSCGRKHLAVNVEPLRDLGMSDDVALHRRPQHTATRQAAVERYTAWLARHPQPGRRIAQLEEELAQLREEHGALRGQYERLRNCASVRAVEQLKRFPLLHSAYMRAKKFLP